MDEWRRFLPRVADLIMPLKARIGIIVLLAIVAAGIGVIEPLILKYFFDEIIATTNSPTEVIAFTAIALLVLSVMREQVNGVHNWLVWKVRLKLQTNLQAAAIAKLYSLPLSYHQREGVGATMTKFERAINGFVAAFSEIAFFTLPTLVYLFASMYVMFQLDWKLSLIVLFFVPVPVLIGMWASKEQIHREKFLIESWTKIYGRLHETFSCLLTVKSLAMEKVEANNFLSRISSTNEYVLKGVNTDTKVEAFKNISITVARVAAIFYGGYSIARGDMTLGTLIAFLGYIGNLFVPVQGVTGVYQTFRKASVSLDILNKIMEVEDPVADGKVAFELHNMKGEVTFEKVSFSYPGNKRVFSNIDLQVNAGETIAIVGPSGGGKSTLMSLILRLHNPTDGVVKIDGCDIRLLRQQSLREQIGIVLQESLLFNDTVGNNIAYGTRHAEQESIEAAAKLANAHEFILELPLKYDTVIGEKGSNLSGGQKQRIAIARNPAILILDEATSALDSETEALVQQAFRRLVKGRTTFVVSHRMANIVDADRIVILKDGSISKIITAKEDIERNQVYAHT
ncbi:ABC transporter ATP-binding protein [Pontibacter kalidii]|uniref:ABC transporter ATP-binding protein n=1 Tax=Pontibacter kalidii TaxID=2592049 RepID=UPI00225B6543|nr:ABC transporter ATP-binding protein [Pontibacter kalidii]